MSAERALREAIQQLAGTHLKDKVKFVDCNVDTINLDAGTCDATPIGEDASVQIININLESEVADGMLIVPVVGSTITVFYSTRNLPYILKYSDIDKVYYSGNLFQFGDGTYGGMVIASNLISQLNTQLTAMLAAITAAYTAQAGFDGGAGLAAWNTAKVAIQNLQSSGLTNLNVKHGT